MSIGKGKNLKPSCKVLRGWTKNEENFEIFYKNLWKIDFFHNFLLHISWSSASSLKVYTYIWKITPDFYNNSSDFGGGGKVPASPPPDTTKCDSPTDWNTIFYKTTLEIYCKICHFHKIFPNIYNGLGNAIRKLSMPL